MRTILFVLLISTAASLHAQNTPIDEAGKTPVEAKFAAGGSLRMDLCSGGIDIVGRDEATIRVSYHADPGYTEGNARVRIQAAGDRADLKITDCPRNHFKVMIEIPKQSGLRIRMFAGELNVKDITGDKDVELYFGQLNMDVGKADDYGRVDASVRSGELDASAFNVEKGGLFRSFDHDGPGKYRLHAHISAGEIDLR